MTDVTAALREADRALVIFFEARKRLEAARVDLAEKLVALEQAEAPASPVNAPPRR